MQGIKFEGSNSKALTKDKKILMLDKVRMVSISLSDHIGLSAICVVKVGDKVLRGQLIGKANGKFSANVYSSISGVVHLIEERITATGDKAICVCILNDYKNKTKKFKPLKDITPENIQTAVFRAGIVGLGGARYPTHLKLDPTKSIHHLLINGAECEDYLTCDDVLMRYHAREVLEGAKLCAKALRLKLFTVAIEDDKSEAIDIMKEQASKIKGVSADIEVVPTFFPIGFEKFLINHALKIKVNQKQYPAEQGVVVLNVATCFAVYEAVKKGKPLFERVVTVTGRAIHEPQNFWVPNGTLFSNILLAGGGEKFDQQRIDDFDNLFNIKYGELEDDAFEIQKQKDTIKSTERGKPELKELKQRIRAMKTAYRKKKRTIMRELKTISFNLQLDFNNVLAQVIAGGVMTGHNVEDLELGIGRATAGVLFLSKNEVDFSEPSPCIKCGKCSKICPMGLFPNKLEAEGLKGNYDECKKLNLGGCINCGCCSYICPAKRELVYHIKETKDNLKKGALNGK